MLNFNCSQIFHIIFSGNLKTTTTSFFLRTLYSILLGGGIKSVALPWTPLNLELFVCHGTFSMNSRVRTDILWPGSRLLIAHNANAYPSVTQASPPAPPPPRTDTCQIFRITTFCPLRGIIIERFVLVCLCPFASSSFAPTTLPPCSPWSSSAAGQATLARRPGCGFSVQLE